MVVTSLHDDLHTSWTMTLPVGVEDPELTVANTWLDSTAQPNSTAPNVTDGPGEQLHVRSTLEVVTLAVILSLVILTTICGNLLVCVTVATNKKLQNCTNYFVVSLATTDLLLGCFVLPFSAMNTLSPVWPLGFVFCNIYTSSDVMLCTVSILTLFAISLDRYFAITTPMRYQQKMNSRMAWRINGAVWICSFLLAFIPIHLGWNSPNVQLQNRDNPTACLFKLNKVYVLIVSLGTYFTPLVVMCGVYLKVLQIARRQVKEINRLTKPGSLMATAAMLEENGDGPPGGGDRRPSRHKESKVVSDTKATVTLASVVLAFTICWIPYFVLFTAKPFLQGPVNYHLDLFALWLGYVNSGVNPFLYAFYNSAFREGFKQVLCHRCSKKRNRMSFSYSSEVPSFKQQRLNSASETSELSALKQHV